MMLNFNPELTNDRGLAGNQRAVARHVDFDHYSRDFTPGSFVIGGAGGPAFVLVTAAAPRYPAIEMPDGGTSNANVSWLKPSEWRAGKLRFQYWYTSPVGSTANFYIQTQAHAVRDGELVTGTVLCQVNTAVAGPAVASTVIRSAYVYSTTSFGGDDEIFSLRIQRLGADALDTNVNVFQLLHVRVEHIPAYLEAQ